MPFTKAYTKQLTELSTKVEETLTNLYQESLVAFTKVLGVKLSKNERLKSLLNKPHDELTPNELAELTGNNESEFGSRQRLTILSKVWNEITRLNKNILENKIPTAEKLTEAIENIIIVLEGDIAPFAENTFKPHELTRRKITFARSFIGLAHRLLEKQFAIQQLLATNVSDATPTHTENKELSEAKATYNQAVAQYNNKYLHNITTHENIILHIEAKIKAIQLIIAELEVKTANLKKPSDETAELQKRMDRSKAKLSELLETSPDENTTLEQFNQLDANIETAATELIDIMRSYQTTVIKKTTDTASTIEKLIEEKRKKLATLIDEIESIIPKHSFYRTSEDSSLTTPAENDPSSEEAIAAEAKALGEYKAALTRLTEHYQPLEKAIAAEIAALAQHSTTLTDLKTQHQASLEQTQQALSDCTSLLLKPDAEALQHFRTECDLQHGAVDDLKTATLGWAGVSTRWTTLHTSVTKHFESLNEQHKTDNALSSPHSPRSVIDKSAITKIEAALKETAQCHKALAEQRRTAAKEHDQRRRRTTHLKGDIVTLVKQTDLHSKSCERALENLDKQIDEVIKSQTDEKTAASDLVQQSNRKRRELLFTKEREESRLSELKAEEESRLSKLKAEMDSAELEVSLLRHRLETLQTKLRDSNITVNENSKLNPVNLLNKLNTLPISPALFQAKNKFNNSSLEKIKNKTDTLESKILSANQNHHYQHKRTLIGGLIGATVSLLLLGGLVASIVFSFPIMLPIMIGVGIAIAFTPGITAAIGRFFGKRKDNAILAAAQLDANASNENIREDLKASQTQQTLARQQSVRNQEEALSKEENDSKARNNNENNSNSEAPSKPPRKKGGQLTRNRRELTRSVAYLSFKQSMIDETFEDGIDDEAAPSFDPAHPPTENERAAAYNLTLFPPKPESEPKPPLRKTKTVRFSGVQENNESNNSKPPYSLKNGGFFQVNEDTSFEVSYEASSPTPQQMQGETSESVLGNAHRPG